MISDERLTTVYLQDDRADLDTHAPMSPGASLLFILGVFMALWACIYVAVRAWLG
ncbi:hypothetical protein [Muricoccus vinaceus]|uniref:Cytochrome c oxidase subunit 2A n=1 Tax=Muricoccus vinaceus TaxID=424704 RepID=A0ABV6IXY7_9PROT